MMYEKVVTALPKLSLVDEMTSDVHNLMLHLTLYLIYNSTKLLI